MMKKGSSVMITFLILIMFSTVFAKDSPNLIIRCDDIGLCHSINMAVEKLIKTRQPISVSVMFCCPWIQEAITILKKYPQVSVGVHLTLNSEWRDYRWGPILGKIMVPSLVDANGYFFPTTKSFLANRPKIEEVEKELRAQIEFALKSGLRIDYIDHHMGTAVATPELRQLFEKLAKEYKLGMSTYFSEISQTLYSTPFKQKIKELVKISHRMEPGNLYLFVFHIGTDSPELKALIDMNPTGALDQMNMHRQKELDALCSKKFKKAINKKNIKLITYRTLIANKGLASMTRPKRTYYNE